MSTRDAYPVAVGLLGLARVWPRLVDTGAKFIIPSRYGDVITIETSAAEIRRSSFDIRHRVLKDGQLAIEAHETRVWTGRDPADPAKIKSVPIPPQVVAAFSRD